MITLVELLLNTVPNKDCLEWAGTVNTYGYGRFYFDGKEYAAHRLAYTLAKGEIPEGLQILHSCDNRCCINPNHLSIGTNQDNVDDMIAKGRHHNQAKTYCKNNHEYTPENTYVNGNRRACLICKREATERSNERRRIANLNSKGKLQNPP